MSGILLFSPCLALSRPHCASILVGDYAQHLVVKERRIKELRAAIEEAFAPGSPVSLELGCGHGHWLTAFAEADSERNFLGADLITQRVKKALAKKEKRGLDHLHFLKGEASEILAAWPADRPLAEIFMLFPDPWPKARHHKHRMIQRPFLDELVRLMAPGARFYYRTDHVDYFTWTEEHFGAHPGWEISSTAPWPWETETVFQRFMDSWQSLIAERVEMAPAPAEATTSRL